MATKLLIDENLPHWLTELIIRDSRGTTVESVQRLKNGYLRGKDDSALLDCCKKEGYILMTCDMKLENLLQDPGSRHYGFTGVIFVSRKSIRRGNQYMITKTIEFLNEPGAENSWPCPKYL